MNLKLWMSGKGDKVWFYEEARPYTIRAFNDRFVVCSKPFNLKKTVIYTVIDLKEQVRGTENLVFGFGAETDLQCDEMAKRLGIETEVSRRNRIPLRVIRIEKATTQQG